MKIEKTILQGCFIIYPNPVEDSRGWFARIFCEEEFSATGKDIHFRQINHSFNRLKGTLRGMHYQEPPFTEEKLIRCIAGSVMDFVIDIRKDSPTFLKSVSFELNADNKCMLLVPKGLAHGFQTLANDTEIIYHHTGLYKPESDRGINYADPMIHIKLPLPITVISDKDKSYPMLINNFSGISI